MDTSLSLAAVDKVICSTGVFEICLIGSLTVKDSEGRDLTPSSSKAKALILLIALGHENGRSRSWLSSTLWPNAADGASLRNEISVLKRTLASDGQSPLIVNRKTVKFDQSMVKVDLFTDASQLERMDLAEGLDVDSEHFNDWLATERSYWSNVPVRADGRRSAQYTEAEGKTATLLVEPFLYDRDSDRSELHAIGLRDELLATLDSFGGLFNVRTSAPEVVDRLLYRVSVSVREEYATQMLRYIVRVTSVRSQRSLWTERFDVQKDANFDVQEKIVRLVVETFQEKLTDGAWSKIWRGKSTGLSAWEAYQRGRYHEAEFKKNDTVTAIECYRKSLAIDPTFWPARVALGFCLSDQIRLGWSGDATGALKEIAEIVDIVLSEQRDNFYALTLKSYLVFLGTSQDEGLRLLQSVVSENPKSPELSAYLGAMYGHCGNIKEEIKQYETALLLTAHPPAWILSNLSIAQATIRCPSAFDTAQKAIQRNPKSVRARIAKICALVERDALSLAKEVAKEIQELEPTFVSKRWSTKDCFTQEEDYERIRSKLAIAGL